MISSSFWTPPPAAIMSPKEAVVDLPGPLQSVPSPDGRYVVDVKALPLRPEQGPRYRLNVRGRGDHHGAKVLTFGRWAALSWAPQGHRFFLTNAIASDRSDCLVVGAGRPSIVKISLTRMILSNPGPLEPSERPSRAHFYVECDRWTKSDEVAGSVFGHAETPALHSFCVPFSYDLKTRRLYWGARQTPGGGLDQSCQADPG